jgi:hypothetical protein
MKKSADLRTPTYLASGARQIFPEGLLSQMRAGMFSVQYAKLLAQGKNFKLPI